MGISIPLWECARGGVRESRRAKQSAAVWAEAAHSRAYL